MKTNQSYTLEIDDGGITVKTPYYPEFKDEAPEVGGKFKNGSWYFTKYTADKAMKLIEENFGILGEPLVDIKIVTQRWGTYDKPLGQPDRKLVTPAKWGSFVGEKEAWYFGRKLADRPSRDSNVKLDPGVLVVGGGNFPGRGGSAKNPCLDGPEGLELIVQDVPLSLAKVYGDRLEILTDLEHNSGPSEEEELNEILMDALHEFENESLGEIIRSIRKNRSEGWTKLVTTFAKYAPKLLKKWEEDDR